MQEIKAAEAPESFGDRHNNLIVAMALAMLAFLGSVVYLGAQGRVAKLDDKCRTAGMSYSFQRGLCVEAGTGKVLDPKAMD